MSLRLILRLKVLNDVSYDNNYYYNIQSFLYNLIRHTVFHNIHDSNEKMPQSKSITPFCFSNIFPYGYMRKNNIRNLIISSPNDKFISMVFEQLKNRQSLITVGAMRFALESLNVFSLKIAPSHMIHTGTPLLIRIPETEYRNYNIELKHPFKYVFWRQTYPLEILLKHLETNTKRKFYNYYNRFPKCSLGLSKFIFRKQISQRLHIHNSTQTIIGTLWDFWFDQINELTKFALDAGLGERNRLGFGFLNPQQ